MSTENENLVRLGLPKGRMQEGVFELLAEAGVKLSAGSRAYRPSISMSGFEVKILKPQNIIEMLHLGSRDLGFAGADWVQELQAEVVELLDTGLDTIRLVAAAPEETRERISNGSGPFVIASEYERLTTEWIRTRRLNASCVRSYGATEVFPPEDADFIVDNTATGATLRANGLVIIDELLVSSTRLYANPRALENPQRREAIERFVLLLRSVLDARCRVMLEANVTAECFENVISALPCMREPTIAQLHGDAGFALRAAVPRKDLPAIIPELKSRGATDIVITNISHIVP